MARSRKSPAIVTSQAPDKPSSTKREAGAPKLDSDQIVQILEGYRTEAEYARLAGPNSRDAVWLSHWDLYWNRFDFSKKAEWQSREVLPEFPQYVDRFAAAMRTALASGEFFTIKIEGDQNGDMARVVRKAMLAILSRVGRSATGQPIDFLNVFEEAAKMAALSMFTTIVTWKDDGEAGYASIDIEDPYNVWLDPTGRNLYRIRRVEMDMHELRGLGELQDDAGEPLYDRDAVDACADAAVMMMRDERQKRTGTGQWVTGNRRPVVLHEYYCTLIDSEGFVQGENVLCVVANSRWLIRGPEANPFWHGRDWMVAAPVIPVPLAPYGKSYAENFARIATTFNEMTNLLLDGVITSAMKVFAIVPSQLEDPGQIEEGIYPNVLFRLNDGERPQDFMHAVEMGILPQDAFQIWGSLKKELQEGAAFNEMTLGQSAPRGRTSATEIGTVEQNSTSYIRAIASNVETGWLEPVLELLWRVTLQHFSSKDEDLETALGPEWFEVFQNRRKEFAKAKIKFRVRGISALLLKRQKLQELMQFLQIIGANEQLTSVFVQQTSPDKLIKYIASLMDIDFDELKKSMQEQLRDQIMQGQAEQKAAQQEQAMQQAKIASDERKAALGPSPETKGAQDFKNHASKRILDHLLQFTPGMQQQQQQQAAAKAQQLAARGGGAQGGPPA